MLFQLDILILPQISMTSQDIHICKLFKTPNRSMQDLENNASETLPHMQAILLLLLSDNLTLL